MTRKPTGNALAKAFFSTKSALAMGIVVVVLFVGSVAFGLNATHGMPLAPRKTVLAAFDDVGGLIKGDDVRIASSRVGYVEDIRMQDGQAVAVLQIDDENQPLYRDSSATTASVGARSALGQKFVDLDPGSPESGDLPEGAVIPKRETRGAQEIGEVFDVFDPKTRAATGSVVRELGGGLAGRSPDLREFLAHGPQMLPDLGKVSRGLASAEGENLGELLRSAERLSGRLQDRDAELAELTNHLGTTMTALGVDEGEPVRQVLQKAPEALRTAKKALDSLNRPLTDAESAMRALRPGAEALGAATDDVRGVLTEGVGPLRKVPGVSEQAIPPVEQLTGLIVDARPLAQRLVNTLNDAAPTLAVLAPYSGEISQFFTHLTDALSYTDDAGGWLRVYLMPSPESVLGTAPIKDPTVWRNPYPAPGEAERAAAPSLVNGGEQ